MSTKVSLSQFQEDDDLSPPRRKVVTADHSSPSRRRDSSIHRDRLSPSQPAKSKRRCLAERYAQWGHGLAQVRQLEDTVKDYLEQAEKPLARYRDDKDLDTMLKQKERQDDPMLKYLSNNISDVSNQPINNSNNASVKPRYNGPDPQTNRFNIWPGYRWDGVNRSNGYENKLFTSIANQHAQAQRTYLWNVIDM